MNLRQHRHYHIIDIGTRTDNEHLNEIHDNDETTTATTASAWTSFKKYCSRRRFCFLTQSRIGVPVGMILLLKFVLVAIVVYETMRRPTPSTFSNSGWNFTVATDRGRVLETRAPGDCISSRKQLVALLLSIFIGELGVDQFYIGNIGLGVGKLLTCGGCGIWWLVDIILIAINDHYRDRNGCKLEPI